MGLFHHIGRTVKSGNVFGNSAAGQALASATLAKSSAGAFHNAMGGRNPGSKDEINHETNPWTTYKNVNSADLSAPGEKEAADQAAFAKQQQEYIGKNLGLVDEAYGIGDSDAAHENAGHLGSLYSGLVSSFRAAGDKSLNDNFGKALTANRATMASSGLNGSGVDADQQTKNLGELVTGKQDVNAGGANFLDQVKGTINTQRLGLKDQIRNNGAVDLGDSSTFANQSTAINQAIGQIPSQTLGNVFSQVGTNYANGNIAGAYGNAGNSAFGQNLGLRVNPSGGRKTAGSIS